MEKAKTGRPRSETSREAILAATLRLLSEPGGGLTIEAVAKQAKVGKPTIYRWWPSLADIALEALLRQADADIAAPACESWRETLRQFLRLSVKAIVDGAGPRLRYLMAHAQRDEGFRERFRENFVAKRREALRSIFLDAMARGQIGSEHDLEIALDIVFGAMWYRLLTGHAPLDEAFADALAETVFRLVPTFVA